MILKELTTDHYIIVDDSEIKEGDWYVNNNVIFRSDDSFDKGNNPNQNSNNKKITHSTQPFNCNCSNRGYRLNTSCAERNHCFDKIQYLSLQEIKELIGEVYVEKKAMIEYEKSRGNGSQFADGAYSGYIKGYTQALEDNKEQKYTEEDMKYMFECGRNYQNNAEITFKVSIDYLQPKPEWEVEFDENGKLRLV